MATYQTDDGEWSIGNGAPSVNSRGIVILLLKDKAVAYRPVLARACGGVCPALFLSQMIYWSDKGNRIDGWVWKTQREIEQETGLTRYEQETARKRLKECGVLEEKLAGVPATINYRVNFDVLMKLLSQLVENPQTSLLENPKLDCGKPANYSENTAQITNKEETAASRPAAQDELALAPPSDSAHTSPRQGKKAAKKAKPTALAPDAKNYHREMFAALAALCKVDTNIKRGQLNAAAKTLLGAGYKPDDLDKFSRWWYSQDFRGQQGKPPAIGLVGELILQAVQWVPWVPPAPGQPQKKVYDMATLRQWHRQYWYEQWIERMAAERGVNPFTPGAFDEWYDADPPVDDDQLPGWYEWWINRNKENGA